MKKIIIALSIFLFLASNAAEVSQQDIQRFSTYYSNGMNYLKQNQYSSAIVEFKKVLRFSPYDKTTQNALANAYLARGDYYNKTTQEYKKALSDYKSAYFYANCWIEPLGSLAQSAKNEINSLERRLATAQTPAARFQSAKILKAQGELAASGYDFWELKSNNQYKEQAAQNLSNIYKNLNNTILAMDYIKTAISINPKNPKLHFLYGVMLDEAGNFEASIEQYNLAMQYGDNSPELMEILENKWTQNIVNNPTDSNGYVNLGAIYQKQGNLEAARAQYLKATQLSSDPVVFYNLASLYVQQNNYNAALNVYNQLLEKNPKNIEVLEYKAQALKKLNRYEEALKQYEDILALDPSNQNAKNESDNIILNHFSGQKLEEFLAKKALQSPNNYEAQFNYALELHKNKKLPQALNYYLKALQINPSKEEVYLNLASIYLEQKQFDKAIEICQRGLLVLPNSASLAANINEAKNYASSLEYDNASKLFEQKRYREAINSYLKIKEQTPEVKLALAGCYWYLNDFTNAKKYYNEVLALDKTNADALEMLDSIKQTELSNLIDEINQKYEKEDYKTSLELANKLLSIEPNNELGYYYKALNLDTTQDYKGAVGAYEKFLKLKKEQDDLTAFAQNRVKELKDYLSQINGK